MKKLKFVKTFEAYNLDVPQTPVSSWTESEREDLKKLGADESFQINEEISLRGLAPIIASLFLTFNSFDASAYNGSRRYRSYATEEIHRISNKIENDLKRLKSETQDKELLRLIQSVNSLDGWQASDGMEQVNKVVEDLRIYIQSNDINDPLINDTLNNLKTGDIQLIESDYQILLQKYEEIDSHYDNMKLILIIVCTLIASFWVMLGIKLLRNGLG